MNLIELKNIWEAVNSEVIEKDTIDERVIEKSIHQKSQSVISKIKVGIVFKLIVGSLAGIISTILVLVSIAKPEDVDFLNLTFSASEYTIFFTLMALAVIVMVLSNFRALKVIRGFEKSTLDLKTSLAKAIVVMESTIRLNIYSDSIITPIIVTWLTYVKVFSERELTLKLGIVVLFVVPIVTFAASFITVRYFQKLRFGNYVNRLKSCLTSLE